MQIPFVLSDDRREIRLQIRAMRYGFFKRPKYITTGEVVHPSVLKVITRKNESTRYVMAVTPYPNLDARYENPSIIFSDDGINWYEGKVLNPIFPPPKNAVFQSGPHNFDPDIVFSSRLKKAFLFFIHFGDGSKHIRVLSSDDFVNWKDMGSTNIEAILPTHELRVSPSIIYLDDEARFILYVVRVDLNLKDVRRIEVFTSNDCLFWHKIGETSDVLSFYEGARFFPWHISVRKVGDEYWMIAAMNHGNLGHPPMYLFFFRSYDGLRWEGHEKPVLLPSGGFDNEKLYRADFIVEKDLIHIWYSAMSKDKKYSIGYVSGKLKVKTSGSNNLVYL